MAKVKLEQISKEERLEIIGEFFSVVSELKTKKEVIEFFVGTLTPSEALILSRRMQIAKRIIEKKTYREIKDELKVGDSTITKVVEWLNRRNESYKKLLIKYLFKGEVKKREKNILNYKENKKYSNNDKVYFQKNKLYNYPGYELAAKVLGIEYIDKKIQGIK